MDDREMFSQFARERGPRALLAQQRVYEHYAPQFFAYLNRRGVPEADRQDLIQDTFLKAYNSIDAILASSSPRSYVWKILIRACHDWYRRNFRRMTVGVDLQGESRFRYVRRATPGSEIEVEGIDWFDLDVEESENDPVYQETADQDLRDCFERASRAFLEAHPTRRHFIELHVVAQMRDEDIAVAIGRNSGATREFLSQCRKRFMTLLETMCGPNGLLETKI